MGDQARTATPADAARAGADFLVIGRPIIEAADPAAVVDEVLADRAVGPAVLVGVADADDGAVGQADLA